MQLEDDIKLAEVLYKHVLGDPVIHPTWQEVLEMDIDSILSGACTAEDTQEERPQDDEDEEEAGTEPVYLPVPGKHLLDICTVACMCVLC